jgi:hypothetical protein
MGVWRSAFGVRRLAFGVRRSAFGVWRSAFGVRRLAFGGWRVFGSGDCPLTPLRSGLPSIFSGAARAALTQPAVAITRATPPGPSISPRPSELPNLRRHKAPKKRRGGNKRVPASRPLQSVRYADCLYEIGIVNTPVTEGLNFHWLATQRVAE